MKAPFKMRALMLLADAVAAILLFQSGAVFIAASPATMSLFLPVSLMVAALGLVVLTGAYWLLLRDTPKESEAKDTFKKGLGVLGYSVVFSGFIFVCCESIVMCLGRVVDGTGAATAAYLVGAFLTTYSLLHPVKNQDRLVEGVEQPKNWQSMFSSVLLALAFALVLSALLWIWRYGFSAERLAVLAADFLGFACTFRKNVGGPGKVIRAAKDWIASFGPAATVRVRPGR